ncbi:choice-of-anchor M domain-containing protein [Actinomycetaceae bacterium L2_0104]
MTHHTLITKPSKEKRKRLVRTSFSGALLLALVTAVNAGAAWATPNASDPEDDPALEQQVSENEEIGNEQVVFDQGHVDIGPRLVDGEWELLARDDSVAPAVWRHLDDMVFQLSDASIQPAPESEDFDFIPAEPGEDLYLIPQIQDYEVPWLGWNTQDPEVIEQLVHGMTMRLHGVEGPGDFVLFLQSGNFDPPQLLWDSAQLAGEGSEPQDIWADINTHVHANWVFTEPGVYLLDVEVFGELSTGEVGSDREVLRFAVGDGTDPQDGFAAELQNPAPENSTQAADENPRESAAQDDDGLPTSTVAILVGGAALVLGIVALFITLRSRKARREAEEDPVSARGSQ